MHCLKIQAASFVLTGIYVKPGEVRVLVLERVGKRVTVRAPVTAF
jgi:hypothetical protein